MSAGVDPVTQTKIDEALHTISHLHGKIAIALGMSEGDFKTAFSNALTGAKETETRPERNGARVPFPHLGHTPWNFCICLSILGKPSQPYSVVYRLETGKCR